MAHFLAQIAHESSELRYTKEVGNREYFHKYDVGRLRLLLLLICSMMAACIFSGCKTTRYVPLERTVYRESVRCDTLQWRDSIHIHDSVYISQRGDTVFRDRWHRETVLKKIYQTKVDSFVKYDSIPVPYPAERELSGWEQFRLRYAAWALLCVVLLWQGYKLYK